MANVLITGATGFIGSHVARVALQDGHDVSALIRETSDTWRLRDLMRDLRFVRADLRDSTAVATAAQIAAPEVCVHAAWYAEPELYLTSEQNIDHVAATWRLTQALGRAGCRRFVGVGTCFEYDTNVEHLSEDSNVLPRSLYAASKLAAYLVLEQLAAQYEMEAVWPRLFYQYGPFEDNRRLVPMIIRALRAKRPAKLTNGDQVRDYLHVLDVARALWAVSAGSEPGVVNIGSGTPVRVRDVARILGDLFGRPDLVQLGAIPERPDDPPVVYAVNRRLVEGYGWRPLYRLSDGLADTVSWWHSELDRQTAEQRTRNESNPR